MRRFALILVMLLVAVVAGTVHVHTQDEDEQGYVESLVPRLLSALPSRRRVRCRSMTVGRIEAVVTYWRHAAALPPLGRDAVAAPTRVAPLDCRALRPGSLSCRATIPDQ